MKGSDLKYHEMKGDSSFLLMHLRRLSILDIIVIRRERVIIIVIIDDDY